MPARVRRSTDKSTNTSTLSGSSSTVGPSSQGVPANTLGSAGRHSTCFPYPCEFVQDKTPRPVFLKTNRHGEPRHYLLLSHCGQRMLMGEECEYHKCKHCERELRVKDWDTAVCSVCNARIYRGIYS